MVGQTQNPNNIIFFIHGVFSFHWNTIPRLVIIAAVPLGPISVFICSFNPPSREQPLLSSSFFRLNWGFAHNHHETKVVNRHLQQTPIFE